MPETSALNIPHSPIAALGTITLLCAFVVAAYSATAGIVGNTQHRRRLVTSSVYALYAFFALTILASALLVYAFVTHDYTIKYVTLYSDTTMPIYYKITAYWGGLDGSLLFWVTVLAIFSTIAVKVNHARHRDMIGYVVAVIMLVQIFFLALLIYNKNPFATWLTTPPVDGKGLNPLLQNYWMVIHPPATYIGFVAATIPFAFGIGALASGRLDDKWLSSVRVWTLICWFFLSLGLVLGGRWAYEELGWGGYWAWDPVENAGLLPWFTATAFLHAVIIQEQRGMMKIWNLVLVVGTFFLTIFGTFMTRSGVVQSVHAFGEDNRLAILFILFMAAILIFSFGLILFRMPQLRSSNTFESFVSREFAFLLNNWILLACAFFVLFATMFPTLSEAVNGERITVGPPFFNKWMTPLGLTLLFLAGAAPLLAWRRTTPDRLWGQFLFPTAMMCATIGGLAAFFPRTRVLTPIFSDLVQLPVALVNFGLVAFTIACVAQEFVLGVRVRMRQTGSDPATSLAGLVLSKRRKYGGYIVHVGVAVLFFGFAGKAWETMKDFTLVEPDRTDATSHGPFKVRDYTFEFRGLTITDDDHKRAITAHVALFRAGEDQELKVLRPARWQYKKHPDEPTTEVDIYHTMAEDVYLILTGFNPDAKVANFRLYINPLINWVWLGFAFLTLGCALCLIPQRWSEGLSARRKTRGGRAAEAAVMILVVAGISAGMVKVATAQGPGAQYEEAPVHDVGGNFTSLYLPWEATHAYRARAVEAVKHSLPGLPEDSGEFAAEVTSRLKPIEALAAGIMKEHICLCGCPREPLLECKCGIAAQGGSPSKPMPSRREILELLAATEHDLMTEAGRAAASEEVGDALVARYEERVRIVPRDKGFNRLSWVVPYAALGGALLLLYGFGRRWVRQGKDVVREQNEIAQTADREEDDQYAELLDDELSKTE